MQTKFKLALVTAACAITTGAFAQVTMDGLVEIDTAKTTAKDFGMSGFGEVNLNGTAKKGDNFASGKITIRQNLSATGGNSTLQVRDAWVKLGNSAVDFQMGRFEAADLAPTNDIYLNKNVGGYQANTLRGRKVDGEFHGVLGFNAGAGLRAEIGLVAGQQSVATVTRGIRPTVVYSSGPLTLRGGVESIHQTGVATQTGFGLSASFGFMADGSVNVNYAKNSKADKSTFGVDGKIAGFQLGLSHDTGPNVSSNTVYGSYTIGDLMGVKGLSLIPAFSHSSGGGLASQNTVGIRTDYAF